MLETTLTQSVATRSQPTPEVVKRLDPVMVEKSGGTLMSRINKSVTLDQLKMPRNPINGREFTPVIPDNTPPGTVLTVSYMDQATMKTIAVTYVMERTSEGQIYAKPFTPHQGLKTVIGKEITGDELEDFEPRRTLTMVGVGDDINKVIESTTFQKISQTTSAVPARGDDYYSVAIATPARLAKVRG